MAGGQNKRSEYYSSGVCSFVVTGYVAQCALTLVNIEGSCASFSFIALSLLLGLPFRSTTDIERAHWIACVSDALACEIVFLWKFSVHQCG